MKLITAILLVVLGAAQYGLWFSKGGVREYLALKREIVLQQKDNTQAQLRNQILMQEVGGLKKGSQAIEEHARNDLGMIKPGETFYRIIPKHQNSPS